MSKPMNPTPPRLPPDSRVPVLFLTPPIFAYGVWTVITGRIGKGPTPIEGPLAMILGVVFATFAAILFVLAWKDRGRGNVSR